MFTVDLKQSDGTFGGIPLKELEALAGRYPMDIISYLPEWDGGLGDNLAGKA